MTVHLSFISDSNMLDWCHNIVNRMDWELLAGKEILLNKIRDWSSLRHTWKRSMRVGFKYGLWPLEKYRLEKRIFIKETMKCKHHLFRQSVRKAGKDSFHVKLLHITVLIKIHNFRDHSSFFNNNIGHKGGGRWQWQ